MFENHAALIVSGISLVATVFNTYLKLQISNELLRMRKDILDDVDKKYVRLPQPHVVVEARS